MFSTPDRPTRPTFATVLDSFGRADGSRFADILTEEDIDQACRRHGVHFAASDNDVWTPALTLWTFLSQCLSSCKSCVAAVARAMVLRVALGLPPCSAETGAYCKARPKLPEAFLRDLTLQVGNKVEDQAADEWRWYGRRVILADGAELSMPDTPENQEAYPQSNSQKVGLGFPHLRLVVLLTFATASVVGAAMGPCQGKESGETALFRSLLPELKVGDLVVADRFYCSYWLVVLLMLAGVDVAVRMHQARGYDFRRGRRLGRGDHVVCWIKPERPDWMDQETYECLPDQLEVREVQVTVREPGQRVRNLVVVTTLLDARFHPQGDIADLYHQRWHVELDLRNIKQTLGMDILSCKTPEMIRKEVWTHLLGYNLVRQVLAQAAVAGECAPRQLSFAGAVQIWEAFRWFLTLSVAGERGMLMRVVLVAVSTHRVGNRPNRVEPREVKRRKKVRLMTRPRAERRAELLRGLAAEQN
jgi:hypothetical protein